MVVDISVKEERRRIPCKDKREMLAAMLLLSILCTVQIGCPETGYILITVFFLLVIFLMAPVENNNKHLNQTEYKVYRKSTRLILLLEGTLFMLALSYEWKELVVVLTIDFFIVAVSLLAGWIKLQIIG